MDIGEFVREGWSRHGDHEQEVFDSLPEGVGLVTEAKHGPALAGLVVHVAGEHLGRWSDGLGLVEQIAAHPSIAAGTPEWKSLQRSKAVLHHCAGDTAAAIACIDAGRDEAQHEHSGRARVLAIASSALLGQKRIDEAMAAFSEAIELTSYGPTKEDPVAISLAIAGNNLASDLEEWSERSDAASALMLAAAQAGRRFWEIAGTWTNVERAEYRLAMTNIQLGDATAAVHHASACLAVCEANEADAIERFFAHEALSKAHAAGDDAATARVHRDAAAALVADIEDEDMRSYCAGELVKLDVLLA